MKNSKGYRIFIRDEESIIKEFSTAERTTILDNINPETEYKPHSFIYKFGKNRVLDKDSIIEFIKETKEEFDTDEIKDVIIHLTNLIVLGCNEFKRCYAESKC